MDESQIKKRMQEIEKKLLKAGIIKDQNSAPTEILLGLKEIKTILFQRGNYLFIDGVLGYDLTSTEKTLAAIFRVPMDPPWLNSHVLDGIPIMPGTDLIHCGLQAAAILFHLIKKVSLFLSPV